MARCAKADLGKTTPRITLTILTDVLMDSTSRALNNPPKVQSISIIMTPEKRGLLSDHSKTPKAEVPAAIGLPLSTGLEVQGKLSKLI